MPASELLLVCVCLSEKCESALRVVVGVCMFKETYYIFSKIFSCNFFLYILCSLCKFNSPIIIGALLLLRRHYCAKSVGISNAGYSNMLINRTTITGQIGGSQRCSWFNYNYHFNDESSWWADVTFIDLEPQCHFANANIHLKKK